MDRIPVKSAEEIERMRVACDVTATILDALDDFVQPGITTDEIDAFVHEMTLEHGARPSTLNYKGYPKSCCTSINDVVCHGIPSNFATLNSGDIVNIDITSYKEGMHGDSSRMFFVGGREACTPEAQTLVDITHQAMEVGISQVKPGAHFGDIGASIQKFIVEQSHKYGIVREYTGHGIGAEFHEPPQVVHVGRFGFGPEMKEGMIFTIEPMINLGTHKTVLSSMDGWTVRTADGKLSAQWEHTCLVTADGVERLTATKKI